MTDKPTCFVMMPISTPEAYIKELENPNHFKDILDYLHTPAIEKAGYKVVSPISTGSELIHADIIHNISNSDLVLCDMSGLNPNVFFEFGIRCALNKPVALVVDDRTEKIPFDTGMINRHTYKSKPEFKVNEEIDKIAKHIEETVKRSGGENTLWKRFRIAQTAIYNPESTTEGDKLDYIINLLAISSGNTTNTQNRFYSYNYTMDSYLESMFQSFTDEELKVFSELSPKEFFSVLNEKANDLPNLYSILNTLDERSFIRLARSRLIDVIKKKKSIRDISTN